MALKFKKPASAEAVTNVVQKNKGIVISEDQETEKVDVPESVSTQVPSDKPWCEVGFEASYTMNLGDFNSTRVSVSLKIPCLNHEIDSVFDYGKEWVNSKMEACISEIKDTE